MKDIRRGARKPFRGLDQDSLKAACLKMIEKTDPEKLKKLLARRKTKSCWTLKDVVKKCGRDVSSIDILMLISYLPLSRMTPDLNG